MRATTRTILSFGDLVDIPVGIATATSSADVKFDTATADGHKREQQYVHPVHRTTYFKPDEEGELQEVELPDVVTDTVKGLRIGGDLRRVPDSELAWAKATTKLEAIEVLEFIDYRRVPTDRLAGSYWLQPDPGFAKPLRTVMDALRRSQKAALVKFNLRDRQRLGVIRVRKTPDGDALLLNAVYFAAEWRDADEAVLAPAQAEAVSERAVLAAVEIIEARSGDGSVLDTAQDDLLPVIDEIVEHAQEGTYDDPAKVLALAARLREEEDLVERADKLVAYAEERWPTLAEQREQAEEIIASGDNVGERLAALVG